MNEPYALFGDFMLYVGEDTEAGDTHWFGYEDDWYGPHTISASAEGIVHTPKNWMLV